MVGIHAGKSPFQIGTSTHSSATCPPQRLRLSAVSETTADSSNTPPPIDVFAAPGIESYALPDICFEVFKSTKKTVRVHRSFVEAQLQGRRSTCRLMPTVMVIDVQQ